ncbi:inosose dehydratase [Anaerobacterium chartisolvens]|uniref:Inosose dehydratase n=1 Tax=Anaerobacterium chartisolvens TaxID=1297424 RepID=A0A369B3E4_9FIRM|nr:sugar phosphate isomerase/epimerase [Anaerobacterium chartisolvens]RCX16049.1 inosose dehydratase [Anaerobacterium chartisolvens]
MENLKYSYMMHWKLIPYKKIENFRDFYYIDRSNKAYFSDWDKIVKYHVGAGYKGIELMPFERHQMKTLFGSIQNFVDFIKERGLEGISGMFHGLGESFDRSQHKAMIEEAQEIIDDTYAFGGELINLCPVANYNRVGPLSTEQLKAIAEVVDEIGKRALDKGISVCLHNEFFCATNTENHNQFLEMTDPRYVFYCLDTAQVALMGIDPVEFYDKYHDRVKTFHLKDTASAPLPDSVRHSQDPEIQPDGHRWFWEPGEGDLDFKSLWKLLKKYNQKGWVTIETDGTPDLLASMVLTKWYIDHELSPIYK